MKYLNYLGQFFTKSKKRIAILLVFILLIVGYLLTAKQEPSPTSGTSLLPIPTRTLTLQEQNALQQNKQRLISQLPYLSDQFTVQYFPDQDYFFIQIQKQPYEENKTLAENWLGQNGINPASITIQWGSVRGAGPTYIK